MESSVRERIKQIREYRHISQETMASLVGVTKQAWGRKERGEIDGFSPEDFAKILDATAIDARWLFGQMGNEPIESADLRVPHRPDDQAIQVAELLAEYRATKEQYSRRDSLAERLQQDVELREFVELMVENRGLVGEVRGFVRGLLHERDKREHSVESA